MIAEFVAFARDGGPTLTSPVAARQAVAAGLQATASIRDDDWLQQLLSGRVLALGHAALAGDGLWSEPLGVLRHAENPPPGTTVGQ